MLNRLDLTIASGKVVAIADITHAIIGASVGIGAAQLAARCSELDRAVNAGDSNRLTVFAAELRRCFEETAAQLASYPPREGRADARFVAMNSNLEGLLHRRRRAFLGNTVSPHFRSRFQLPFYLGSVATAPSCGDPLYQVAWLRRATSQQYS